MANQEPDGHALFSVAERDNPKRRFLFVSRVLGKYLPTDGRICRLAGVCLALRVADDPRYHEALQALLGHDAEAADQVLDSVRDDPAHMPGGVVVIGFAETATALGHAFADALDADAYVHTTRLHVEGEDSLSFTEDHSHAPDQRLYARGLPAAATCVLVDDELTTGRTARNLTRSLHQHLPYERYVYATLIDRIDVEDNHLLLQEAEQLGARIDVVSLASSAEALLPTSEQQPVGDIPKLIDYAGPAVTMTVLPASLRAPRVVTARTVMSREDRHALNDYVDVIAPQIDFCDVVLGCGEFMALATKVAARLRVDTWSTTRGPVRVSEETSYPINSGIRFANPEDNGVAGYLYNSDHLAGKRVCLLMEDAGRVSDATGLLEALQGCDLESLQVIVCR